MSIKTILYTAFFTSLTSALAAAQPQPYPARPVRTLVALTAGGSMDTVTRALSVKLGEAFGQSFVVDNRPSAGALVALDILSSSALDGHTLMMIGGSTVVYPILYKSRYDMRRDIAPIAQVSAQGYVLMEESAGGRLRSCDRLAR